MENFNQCFKELEDPRTGNASRHNLLEMLVIALCTVLCGGQTAVDMEDFGIAKEEFLRDFLVLEHGLPSHDTFSRTCLSGCRRRIALQDENTHIFNFYVSIHQVLPLCRDFRMLANIPLLWLN